MRWQPLALLFFLTGGCATLFSESSQMVSVQSEPQGVKLYLNGKYVGETPVEIEVDRDTFKSRVVMLKKEGYHIKQFNLAKTINSMALFNLTSMTPWTTDAVSGNMIEYSPNAYFIEMEAKGALSKRNGGAALLKRFVLYNYDNVLSGIAEGGGEYMVAVMELLEVPNEKRGHFIHALQQRMPKLVENRSPLEVIHAIEQEAGDYSERVISHSLLIPGLGFPSHLPCLLRVTRHPSRHLCLREKALGTEHEAWGSSQNNG